MASGGLSHPRVQQAAGFTDPGRLLVSGSIDYSMLSQFATEEVQLDFDVGLVSFPLLAEVLLAAIAPIALVQIGGGMVSLPSKETEAGQ